MPQRPARPAPSPALLACALAATLLAGCGNDYSPDTYATRAVQQANRAEQGVIVGVRRVQVRAEGSTGAAAGAAAGGVVGAQTPGGSIGSALGTVGGALVGGIFGKAAEHAVVDTQAYEYVVRTAKGDLLAVTQTDERPLELGQRVLVITGNQARVVADYTTPPPAPAATSAQPPAQAAHQAIAPLPAPVPPAAVNPGQAAAEPAAPAAPAPIAPPAAAAPEAEAATGSGGADRGAAIPIPMPRPVTSMPQLPAPAGQLLQQGGLANLPPSVAAVVPAIAQ